MRRIRVGSRLRADISKASSSRFPGFPDPGSGIRARWPARDRRRARSRGGARRARDGWRGTRAGTRRGPRRAGRPVGQRASEGRHLPPGAAYIRFRGDLGAVSAPGRHARPASGRRPRRARNLLNGSRFSVRHRAGRALKSPSRSVRVPPLRRPGGGGAALWRSGLRRAPCHADRPDRAGGHASRRRARPGPQASGRAADRARDRTRARGRLAGLEVPWPVARWPSGGPHRPLPTGERRALFEPSSRARRSRSRPSTPPKPDSRRLCPS